MYCSPVRDSEPLGLIETESVEVDVSVDFHLPYPASNFCRTLQRPYDLGFDYFLFTHIFVWLHPETPWPGYGSRGDGVGLVSPVVDEGDDGLDVVALVVSLLPYQSREAERVGQPCLEALAGVESSQVH